MANFWYICSTLDLRFIEKNFKYLHVTKKRKGAFYDFKRVQAFSWCAVLSLSKRFKLKQLVCQKTQKLISNKNSLKKKKKKKIQNTFIVKTSLNHYWHKAGNWIHSLFPSWIYFSKQEVQWSLSTSHLRAHTQLNLWHLHTIV